MAKPLSGRGTVARAAMNRPRFGRVKADRRNQKWRWPVIVVVGACAIYVLIGVAIGGYALAHRSTRVAIHESPSIFVERTVNQPQPSEEPPPQASVPARDLPAEKVAPGVILIDVSQAKSEPVGPAPPSPESKKQEPPTKQEPPKEAPAVTAAFKTRKHESADELAKHLLLAPEIGLDPIAAESVIATGKSLRNQVPHPPPELLLQNPGLAGLPVRMGLDCHLGKEAAENLEVLSRKLRKYLSESVPRDRIDTRPDATALRKKMFTGADGIQGEWKQAEAIPALLQLLQAEDKPIRLLLVEVLSDLKSREASIALAQRALFDLSGEVRAAAVKALVGRPRDEYGEVLFQGLHYPWPAVADHAAEALVALKEGDTMRLIELLDRPDPSSPYVKGSKGRQTTVVQEVVRVNHLKNCVLCHAPSYDQKDLVRGLVPDPKKEVPPSFTQEYYVSNRGIFVRADVTYLKQDFSVPQPVAKHGEWPAAQRYDYFVRTRLATTRDFEAAKEKPKASYPQRDSVLFALRELTGKDAGTASRDWRALVAMDRVAGDRNR